MYLFISFLAGIIVVLVRIINSNLSKKIGLFQGTFINYIVGLALSIIFFIVFREKFYISNELNVPIIAYFGGLVGVAVVVLSNIVTHKISAYYLTILIFTGQIITGLFIDYITLNVFSLGKLIGAFFVAIGLIYNLSIDKKTTSQ